MESTLLELSNDVKFVEILVKTTENTIRYSEPPFKLAYAHRSHDRVLPPLVWVSDHDSRVVKLGLVYTTWDISLPLPGVKQYVEQFPSSGV